MSKYGILLRGLLTDWTKYIIEEYEEKHKGDKTGKSMTYNTRFKMLSSGDFLEVSFYDWSKKMEDEKEWKDNIKVIILSNEFNDFLKTYY